MFCRWDANDIKGSITIELCKIIVKKYYERLQRPGKSLYQDGGLVETSMDFGLWQKDNVRRIKKQIRKMYEEE